MCLPANLASRIPSLPVDPPGPPQGHAATGQCDKRPEPSGSRAVHVERGPSDGSSRKSLRASRRACRRTTRHHAKTFHFASRFLHRAQREHACAVYAYCRYIDDLIDEPEDGRVPPPPDDLFAENRLLLAGEHTEPFAEAFRRTCCERSIPVELLDDLVRGCCRDRGRVRIADRDMLWGYCYLVASVPGLMMARVFGVCRADAYEQAAAMGLAMQLTNILRDIAEDHRRDRIYLPADELTLRGLSVDVLLRDGPSPSWRTYLKELADTARSLYRTAETGIPAITDPRGARATLVMSRVYGGILDEIERADFDIRQRRYVPLPRKIHLALPGIRKTFP